MADYAKQGGYCVHRLRSALLARRKVTIIKASMAAEHCAKVIGGFCTMVVAGGVCHTPWILNKCPFFTAAKSRVIATLRQKNHLFKPVSS